MPRHQTGELQGLSLSDGVDSLRVPLLLNIAGMPWVYNADSWRGCRGGEKNKAQSALAFWSFLKEWVDLAQQMVYWLRGCLTENTHCGHVCTWHNRPEVEKKRRKGKKKNRDLIMKTDYFKCFTFLFFLFKYVPEYHCIHLNICMHVSW